MKLGTWFERSALAANLRVGRRCCEAPAAEPGLSVPGKRQLALWRLRLLPALAGARLAGNRVGRAPWPASKPDLLLSLSPAAQEAWRSSGCPQCKIACLWACYRVMTCCVQLTCSVVTAIVRLVVSLTVTVDTVTAMLVNEPGTMQSLYAIAAITTQLSSTGCVQSW